MFISKKHISRRTILKGAGATLALPLLDAMVPAATALAQTAANPVPRFVGCFVPHGAAPGYWVPEKVGANPDFPFNWKPLEAFREQVTILSGMHSRSAEPPPGATGADHWVAAAFLAGSFVLLELGTRWSVRWQSQAVQRSGVFCYRERVRAAIRT